MPRERMEWPDDGIIYITRGFAGYFAYGEWRPDNVDEWQGTFVVDLRMTPLQPVKLKMKRIHSFIYSEELDFYAHYTQPLGEKCLLAERIRWRRRNGHACVICPLKEGMNSDGAGVISV